MAGARAVRWVGGRATKVQPVSDGSFRGRFSRRELLRLVASIGGASATLSILSACQPARVGTPASGPTVATAAATPVTAQQGPATTTASQVVVLQGVDANTPDPSFRNSTPEFNINAHIFSMMTARDATSLQIVPEFLREWKLVDDLTWDFKFPSGAKFHDGTPIDAEAVAFSLTRYAKKNIGGKPTIQGTSFTLQTGFESATPVDATTVRIKTSSPAAI